MRLLLTLFINALALLAIPFLLHSVDVVIIKKWSWSTTAHRRLSALSWVTTCIVTIGTPTPICLTTAVLAYFLYGIRHSRLNVE